MTITNWSQDAYLQAWDFACQAHQGQVYQGPKPDIIFEYSTHLAGVAMEVSHALLQHPKYDGNLAMQCALLHDTLEDTAVTYDDLLENFSKAVADGVSALSKNESLPRQEQMSDSLRRICQQPKEVWLVKLADRINNLQYTPPHWSQYKVDAYRTQSYMILEMLGTASPQLAQRLAEHIYHYGEEDLMLPVLAQAA